MDSGSSAGFSGWFIRRGTERRKQNELISEVIYWFYLISARRLGTEKKCSRNNSFPLNFCLFNFLISHDTQIYILFFCGAILVFRFLCCCCCCWRTSEKEWRMNRRTKKQQNTQQQPKSSKPKNVLGCQTVFSLILARPAREFLYSQRVERFF